MLARIEAALGYARHRRGKFRWRASAVRVTALVLSATSTIILGLCYYLAAHRPEQLDIATIKAMFDRYQGIWEQQSDRWLEYRRTAVPGG